MLVEELSKMVTPRFTSKFEQMKLRHEALKTKCKKLKKINLRNCAQSVSAPDKTGTKEKTEGRRRGKQEKER